MRAATWFVLLCAVEGPALADRVDDALDRVDRSWSEHRRLDGQYREAWARYQELWQPVVDAHKAMVAAKKTADDTCARAHDAACTDATLRYAAAYKKWWGLNDDAERADAGHHFTGGRIDKLHAQVEAARQARDADVAAAKAVIAETKMTRTALDDRLKQREDARRAAAASQTGADANRHNASSGGGGGGSSGGSHIGGGFVPSGAPNWDGR